MGPKILDALLPVIQHREVLYMNDLHQYTLLAIYGIDLAIGAYVLFRNPHSWVNRSFFLFTLGIALWGGGISLLYLTHHFGFDKVALGGGLVMLAGLYSFCFLFPERTSFSRRALLSFIPLALGLALLPFNLYIESIVVDESGFVAPVNGPLFPVFMLISLGYSVASLGIFGRKFWRASGQSRLQLQYVGLGLGIFVVCMLLFNALLPFLGVYQTNLLGPASSIFFISLTAYAIVRHQFMDIRIALQRGVIYTAIISIAAIAYTITLIAITTILPDEQMAAPVSAGAVCLIGIVTFPLLERLFRKYTDRLFFKHGYTYATALEELSTELNNHTHLNELIYASMRSLMRILRPTHIRFVRTDLSESLSLTDTTPTPPVISATISPNGIPFGSFELGPKCSGDPYTSEDESLLRTFSYQASVAFHKSLLYEELQQHATTLEQKVLERTDHLVALQAMQRTFMDDVSHALQTPLTILKSGIELLASQNTVPDRTSRPIQRSIDDLSRLIRDLMSLARIDTAPAEEEFSTINLSELVQDVAEYVQVACDDKGITLTLSLEAEIYLSADARQMEEALTNVLANAVRYADRSSDKRIHIELAATSDSIILSIYDSGPGIDPERLPYIFERFYRAQEHEGTGLGLAITKRIVERHGGTITAESNNGTYIRFTFPQPQDCDRP